MVEGNRSDENELTGPEAVVIITFFAGIAHVIMMTLSKGLAPGSPPPGMLGTHAGESGYVIRHSGPASGLAG